MPKMTFTAAGDAIITKRLWHNHSGIEPIKTFLALGEARAVNLEAVLTDFDSFASSCSGGTWIGARPQAFDDLLEYGFNLFGTANNHTMDYSYGGLISTLEELDRRNVVHAGTGKNLYEASRPAYLDTPSGRVAMISICSSFNETARAGKQSQQLPGRPGLNPLRFSKEYVVTPEQYNVLSEVAEQTLMNGQADIMMKQGYTAKNRQGTLYFDGLVFAKGEAPEKVTHVNPVDMKRTTEGIEEALNAADYVIILAHSHEIGGTLPYEPDKFFIEFCHGCIDCGASAVIGTGTHQLKPIEIYKGRPIFYSLGNFILQNEMVECLPPDFNEKYGYPSDVTAEEGLKRRGDYGRRGLTACQENYHSVLPYWEIENARLERLTLLPIELGFDEQGSLKGLPSKGGADWTLRYLKQICKPYNTEFILENGMIEVGL